MASATFKDLTTAPFDSGTLSDETLGQLSEEQLGRLASALQATPSQPHHSSDLVHTDVVEQLGRLASTLQAAPSQPQHSSDVAHSDFVDSRRVAGPLGPGARFPLRPVAPIGAAALGALVALCVAVLCALVLKADDPCAEPRRQFEVTLERQLQSAGHERDALRRELQTAIAEREQFRREAERLRATVSTTSTNIAQLSALQKTSSQTSGSEAKGRSSPLQPFHQCPPPQSCPPPLPCPAPVAPTCPPPPPCLTQAALPDATQPLMAPPQPLVTPAKSREDAEDVEYLRAQLVSFHREFERLSAEPKRLQDAYHAQSEQIWHMRAQLAECRGDNVAGA